MIDPDRNCPRCPRLAEYREAARLRAPDWHNAPVPTLGDPETARALVVGLAPGLQGANRTGRPFTGDYAGDILYSALIAHGFATGPYEARPDDALRLVDVAITNAVRCVPPENKPTGGEIANCRPFLATTLASMPRLEAVLALGRIAHDAVLRALGRRLAAHPFAHGAEHSVGAFTLADSYHTSRYNMNTGVLTVAMFDTVVARLRTRLSD